MKCELRINNDGSRYYSFVYYDQKLKRPVRIPKVTIVERFGKDITELTRAKEVCKILVAEMNTMEKRKKRLLEWEDEYYNFTDLLKLYEEAQRKKAPNSWQNSVFYLKYYVLHYFLNIKKCNNISLWFDFYEDFREWLEDKAQLIKQPGKPISYASKNHAIKALNTFMTHLFNKGVVSRQQTCLSFPPHKLNEKGAEDIISAEEMELVYNQLKSSKYEIEAIFYRFLYFTGLRFNEGMGISAKNIYEGEVDDQVFKNQLNNSNIQYFGHIVFNSQPDHYSRGLRDKNGLVKRRPLKNRFKIDDKSGRSVVICDKVLWNELVHLHNHCAKLRDEGLYGPDIENYPLFEGIDKTTSAKRLANAYKACGLKYRSWHACRHTRATELIGKTGNAFLAKLWLGHSSDKVLKRYVHIYESVIRNLKKNDSKNANGQINLLKIIE